jgi:hypothetical protein
MFGTIDVAPTAAPAVRPTATLEQGRELEETFAEIW